MLPLGEVAVFVGLILNWKRIEREQIGMPCSSQNSPCSYPLPAGILFLALGHSASPSPLVIPGLHLPTGMLAQEAAELLC